jgi:translation elongation factor EF-1alpha
MKGDGTVIKELPRAVNGGANAMVELTLSDSVVMETYAGCRALVCFVLCRGGNTIATGVFDETL